MAPPPPLSRTVSLGVALLAALAACAAPASEPASKQAPPRTGSNAAPAADLRAVEALLEELYAAFCFDAGQEADWEAMRALFLPGAAFVAPVREGVAPQAVDAEAFLRDFQTWVRTSPDVRAGLHERILHARVELFGHVAQAWVAFEGFVPGTEQVKTRGLDGIQLVRAGEAWRLVSFTTHYASPSEPLPPRFLRD